eukprot:CAMPEP_0202480654 /NCGR_PEP_ID=MMETSP1361-20130828/555_1 /ASSEMBLY_ACC=CAM_ASM_000849 /TAXON_ID=210615 /ORGANISM="Staurosira complex sp., Strain CCMP2646" /LENGTH=195 /DNA_ID=CAMNT_0049108105 /DNA_START=89 /DNA_END=676 /DNA_ORIENTATION=-
MMKLSILLSLLLPSLALAFTAAPTVVTKTPCSKTKLSYGGYRGGYDDYEYGRGGGLMLPSSKSPRDRWDNDRDMYGGNYWGFDQRFDDYGYSGMRRGDWIRQGRNRNSMMRDNGDYYMDYDYPSYGGGYYGRGGGYGYGGYGGGYGRGYGYGGGMGYGRGGYRGGYDRDYYGGGRGYYGGGGGYGGRYRDGGLYW